MRRTERLFQIIQVLRRHRAPVTGQALAEELEVSLRTLYRDMAELIAQRVPIRGEAGTGYVLEEGYDMPPLMLTADELEAAVLGAQWVAARGDAALSRGARDLIAKLTAAVPRELQPVIVDSGLKPVSFRKRPKDSLDVALVRQAIRGQMKMRLDYADEAGAVTQRTVWPFLLAYWDEVQLICAWCELRQGFRHFRTDRVRAAELLGRFPERVGRLRRRWELDRRDQRSIEKPGQ
ncbi:MAG: YafY family transcriptional regulator [Hyphomonas sp.]|uniref:helix-turn-helix transcriptional regulator n=1 Tax=Hyphomonas sp. TaxID=87 RepID=UPI0017DC9929|nr:YafY family protein [Hyphomonas sp.]MBU3920823.1 YafY family transcriptional regulator [Alphaproteobacteria bacterium]MBA3068838.1 YafY family transcriptional regulator [Hyphomonas sp.]MBU4062951.1 YafY family transcriptional regulator [Alphaproteobacteria bacterium]MBU4165483.1 YafY family transcriptional regulator [Alphaproteobacteria bacterium]MBU4569387.1 YafY family transcriptional regulator [Alphaproteobacteria bacterium]